MPKPKIRDTIIELVKARRKALIKDHEACPMRSCCTCWVRIRECEAVLQLIRKKS